MFINAMQPYHHLNNHPMGYDDRDFLNNDYIIEFYNEINELAILLAHIIVDNLVYTPYGIEDSMANALRFILYKQRDYYLKSRKSGIGGHDTLHNIVAFLFNNKFIERIKKLEFNNQKNIFPEIYSSKAQYLFYCNGKRMFDALKPILTLVKSKSVLFWDSTDIIQPDDLSFSIKILPQPKEASRPVQSIMDYIKRVLYYHTLSEVMIDRINPESIIGTDGCQTSLKILSHTANYRHVESICIQHGWPSFFHGAYRSLPYSRIFTWGKRFNELWGFYNPTPSYHSCGYPYNIQHKGNHDSVTFFLQAPLYLTTSECFCRIYLMAFRCAERFPSLKIQIRSHPEYPLPEKLKKCTNSLNNILYVDNLPIDVVYAQTLVSISHFSSCTMEGLVHGCYSIVFDPVFNSKYYPDLENEGLGFVARTETQAMELVEIIINNKHPPIFNLTEWFEATGSKAARNIADGLQLSVD